MEKTTIMLPRNLKNKAISKAKKSSLSLGEFVRRALEMALLQPETSKKGKDSFFSDTRVFTGEVPTDIAKNHDKYLYGDDNQ